MAQPPIGASLAAAACGRGEVGPVAKCARRTLVAAASEASGRYGERARRVVLAGRADEWHGREELYHHVRLARVRRPEGSRRGHGP